MLNHKWNSIVRSCGCWLLLLRVHFKIEVILDVSLFVKHSERWRHSKLIIERLLCVRFVLHWNRSNEPNVTKQTQAKIVTSSWQWSLPIYGWTDYSLKWDSMRWVSINDIANICISLALSSCLLSMCDRFISTWKIWSRISTEINNSFCLYYFFLRSCDLNVGHVRLCFLCVFVGFISLSIRIEMPFDRFVGLFISCVNARQWKKSPQKLNL